MRWLTVAPIQKFDKLSLKKKRKTKPNLKHTFDYIKSWKHVRCVSRLTCRAQSRGRRHPDRSSPPPPPLPQPAAPARLSPNRTRRAKIIRVEPEADASSEEILPWFFPPSTGRKKQCIPPRTLKKEGKRKKDGLQFPLTILRRCRDKREDEGDAFRLFSFAVQ